MDYLDETSRRKVSLRERADMDQQIGRKLKHFTDSASKETLGQVHAGGFLHHSIRINPDGTSTAPSQLSNAERKHRITETWQKHLARFPSTARRPVIAHRLVFSMSKEQHDALTDAGINPDQVLHSTMKKVMRRFNERFHPNDSIGYAYGLHHDTANLHVHVAICPRTENGSYVGCSTSRSSQSRHKKQMDCIKSWFELENSRWEKILGSPQKLEEMLSKRLDARQVGFSAATESSAGERAAERPEFRLISVAAALPVNSQSGSIAGQEATSTQRATRSAPCFATHSVPSTKDHPACRQNCHGR